MPEHGLNEVAAVTEVGRTVAARSLAKKSWIEAAKKRQQRNMLATVSGQRTSLHRLVGSGQGIQFLINCPPMASGAEVEVLAVLTR